MGWIILIIIWAAVTVLVGYPYVEKIEKVENDRDRFFPILRSGVGVISLW